MSVVRLRGLRFPRSLQPLRYFKHGSRFQFARPLVLGAFAFSQFDNNDDSGDTREQRMLTYSLTEHAEEPQSLAQKILKQLDEYVWDPLCTILRSFQLTAIFLSVLLAMPLIFFGRRVEGTKGSDRSGAILWYRYLTWAMEAAGPSFIKLGQWAASRTDIFPEGMCEYMGRLHSKAKKHSWRYTKRIVEKELNGSIDSLFTDFEHEPMGIGAMGQVYKASLDGNPVVVKVLHPHIERTIARDLKIMTFFAAVINALPTMEWLSLPGEVETFGVMMKSQLDLRIEAENLVIFTKNFNDRPNIAFPQPYLDYTTRRVMVEERMEAVSMEKILNFASNAKLDHELADVGLDAFLKMLLIDNFIHADLHPGNIMIRFHKSPLGSKKVTSENSQVVTALNKAKTQEEWDKIWHNIDDHDFQLCFIDAGLVTELRSNDRRNFIDLFKAIATFDGYRAGELMVERSRTPETVIDAEVFAMRTQQLVDKVKKRTFALGSVKLGDLLTSMLHMVRNHHVRMESDFITVVLSILLLEGIGRQLNPDLDIFKAAIPILREVSQNTKDISISLNEETLQMLKVWMVLEVRQFIQASIKDVHRCIKYDLLSPNC